MPATAYVYVSGNGSDDHDFFARHGDRQALAQIDRTIRRPIHVHGVLAGPSVPLRNQRGKRKWQRSSRLQDYVGDGSLATINTAPSGGKGAPHLWVHPNGRLVLVAHYTSGEVSTLKVDDTGGVITPPADVQHPAVTMSHQAVSDPSGKFLFVPNIDSNTIFQFTIDATSGKLTPNGQVAGFPDGAGPRHMALHPNGRYAYAINEVADTVSSLTYDSANGKLSNPQTIDSLPPGAVRDDMTSGAHILVHPSGKFVYSSNRGTGSISSISVFAVGPSGQLTQTANETAGGTINMPARLRHEPVRQVPDRRQPGRCQHHRLRDRPDRRQAHPEDTATTPASPTFAGIIFL